MQKITPFLWFEKNLEEAVNFYCSVFKDAKITRFSKIEGAPGGPVVTASFQLHGQEFIALQGGPMFKFNESISFFVRCDTQEEIDYFWSKLTDGGQAQQCGWLKDRFGLSWQIIPPVLDEMLGDKDLARSQRVMHTMLTMKKIEIAALQKAYQG